MGHVANVCEYPQPGVCRVVVCVRYEKICVLIESLGNLNIGWLVFGIFIVVYALYYLVQLFSSNWQGTVIGPTANLRRS